MFERPPSTLNTSISYFPQFQHPYFAPGTYGSPRFPMMPPLLPHLANSDHIFPYGTYNGITSAPFGNNMHPLMIRPRSSVSPRMGPVGQAPGLSGQASGAFGQVSSTVGQTTSAVGQESNLVGETSSTTDIFFCHLCKYSGKSKAEFDAHMGIHFEFRCSYCDYTSRTQGRLKKHIKDFHSQDSCTRNVSERQKVFRCKQCPFSHLERDKFWEHCRTHIKDDKLLQCHSCPFVTEHRHHLEYHILNHSGEKPFKCCKCNYSCVNKSMLNSHMKSHTNVYQYRCTDCTYATKYCHSLKLHMKKYNHRPATVLNQDGSLPHGLDAGSSGLCKSGIKTGKKDNSDTYFNQMFAMPHMPLELSGMNPLLQGMMPFWAMLPHTQHLQPQGLLPDVRNLAQQIGIREIFPGDPEMNIEADNISGSRSNKTVSKDFICKLCNFVSGSIVELCQHLVQLHKKDAIDAAKLHGISQQVLENKLSTFTSDKIMKLQNSTLALEDGESRYQTNESVMFEGRNADSLTEGRNADSLTEGRNADSLTEGRNADSLTEGRNADSLTEGRNADSLTEGRNESSLFEGRNKSSLSGGSSDCLQAQTLLSRDSSSSSQPNWQLLSSPDSTKWKKIHHDIGYPELFSGNQMNSDPNGKDDNIKRVPLKCDNNDLSYQNRFSVERKMGKRKAIFDDPLLLDNDNSQILQDIKSPQSIQHSQISQHPLDFTKDRQMSSAVFGNQNFSMKHNDENQNNSKEIQRPPLSNLHLKRSISEDENTANNSIPIDDIINPRKRSRKGKAYKLNTICMKLQKALETSPQDEDELDSELSGNYQSSSTFQDIPKVKHDIKIKAGHSQVVTHKPKDTDYCLDFTINNDNQINDKYENKEYNRVIQKVNDKSNMIGYDVVPEMFRNVSDKAEIELQKPQKSLCIFNDELKLDSEKVETWGSSAHLEAILEENGEAISESHQEEVTIKKELVSEEILSNEASMDIAVCSKKLYEADKMEMSPVSKNKKSPSHVARKSLELPRKMLNNFVLPVTPLTSLVMVSHPTHPFVPISGTPSSSDNHSHSLGPTISSGNFIPSLRITGNNTSTLISDGDKNLSSPLPCIPQSNMATKSPISYSLPPTAYIPPINRMMSMQTVAPPTSKVKPRNMELYECTFCELSFGDCLMYTVHMGYHSNHNPFQCNSCGAVCQNKIDFFLHIARTPHS